MCDGVPEVGENLPRLGEGCVSIYSMVCISSLLGCARSQAIVKLIFDITLPKDIPSQRISARERSAVKR